MASEAIPSTQAPKPVGVTSGGNSLPAGGKAPSIAARPATTTNQAALPALVAQLNKYLNDSGRPNQFRIDPGSSGKTIQELNPATGEVIGEFPATEFPELARSLGVSGVLVDSLV
jgi:hypothetical protein